jgi:hypothetical protein
MIRVFFRSAGETLPVRNVTPGVGIYIPPAPVVPPPPQPGPTPELPQEGEGFLYLQAGVPYLVEARKLSDESIWRP